MKKIGFILILSAAAAAAVPFISAQSIFETVVAGDVEGLRLLAEGGADVNSRDSDGNTPLMAAALRASGDMTGILLAAGADVSARNIEGRTALHMAARSGSADLIRRLASAGAVINPEDKYGITPAMMAAQSNIDPDVSKIFIAAGAYELSGIGGLLSQSIKSAVYNRNADVLGLYLNLVPDIDSFDILGQTLLMEAARYNPNEEVTALIIDAGADLNLRDQTGKTALSYAAEYNHNPAVIELLLEAGADAAICDCDGVSPLEYAETNEHINRSPAFWMLNDLSYKAF